jgi:hypothetical protein
VRKNDGAALLGAAAGTLLAVSGYSGTQSVERMFTLLVGIFGTSPFVRILAAIVFGIASLGGFSVLFGAYLIWKDRVRLGHLFILIGSGAGFFTLLLFLLVNLRKEEFSFLAHVLPGILGVALGVAARFRSVPKPLLETLRPS